MGTRSSNINRGPNNRSDGHLLGYFRNTFARGGGAISTRAYFVTPSTTSLNEGSSVTFTVNTANVTDGTTLYWTLNTVSGTINASDFSGGAINGSFTVTANTGSVTLTLANDITSEGTESFQLQVRTDSTSGTIVATSSTVTINDTSVSNITATGGTIIDSGGFRIHVFTSPGSFVVSNAGAGLVDYLVVAGGGSGGSNRAGGGGAGGFRTASGFPVTATTYPITIGAGADTATLQGNASIFSSITSTGGGRGAQAEPGPASQPAQTGGSGGGGAANGNPLGAAGNTPPVSPPQGNSGGNGGNGTGTGGAGGGGAGAIGSNGTPTAGGNGGIGSPITWIPASYGTPGPAPGRYFAGGGGGGKDSPGTPGTGGSGGGGNGQAGNGTAATPGTTNTGGGGGGGGGVQGSTSGTAGSGGSGIVAIRYPYV